MKIYFAGSIAGGRSDQALYVQIVEQLADYGEVLTEHIGNSELSTYGELGKGMTDKQIHDRDVDWLLSADAVVAEVTVTSMGVGYELGRVAERGDVPVLALYRPSASGERGKPSSMIVGSRAIQTTDYEDLSEIPAIFNTFFAKFTK
ncbi:MAG: nucleoside 2-deoxyribosyltransferase [Candidatus Doudnabacteria bacterium]|nr:nucleoside 2-deoxyribosyltransferase [Candidatus Doudnabacteria bacterium]